METESQETEHPKGILIILVALFGLVLSLVVIEVVFRFIRPMLKPAPWTDRPYAYFVPQDSWRISDALRKEKESDVFRIVALGDSFTFGPNLQLEDTYPKRIEHALNLNGGAPRVEVLNRGVCGSSTATQVELLRKATLEKPDLVVLNITLNDAEHHILSAREREELFGAPYLSWGIWKLWSSLGFVVNRFHNTQTVKAYIDYHSKFFKSPESLKVFESSLGSMKRVLDDRKIPLLAAIFPLFDFPINERYPFVDVHQIIAGALSRQGIEFIDLKDAYTNIPPLRLQVIPGVDNHPNEIAHRIAAEAIVAELVNRRLVPEAVVPDKIYKARLDARSPEVAHRGQMWKRANDNARRAARARKYQRVDEKSKGR